MSVVIETTIGDVTVDLFIKERPKACLNFIKLCKLKYYNFNLFHTVEQGFIAQTGDPTGEGDKGESVWGVIEGPTKKLFEAELIPKILHAEPGLLRFVYFLMCQVDVVKRFSFQHGVNWRELHRLAVLLHVRRGTVIARRDSLCDWGSGGRT